VRLADLRRHSLSHFWRTNVAVVFGVATAVSVLAGSLLVGESVRESLARLALGRLGATAVTLESSRFFREEIAAALAGAPGLHDGSAGLAPIIAVPGVVSHSESGRQASDVIVYGVDVRFFTLHGLSEPEGLEGRGAFVSEALGTELQARAGDALLVKLTPASEIPGSTLFGRRDEPGRRLRVSMRRVLGRAEQGEFSLRPRQGDVRALFLPLVALQRALGLEGRVNTLLASAAGGEGADAEGADAEATFRRALAERVSLEDLGLRLRVLPARRELALESSSGLLDDAVVAAAREVARERDLDSYPVFVYLANALKVNGREVPYSLVAAFDDTGLRRLPGSPTIAPLADSGRPPGLILNEWAARDLGARAGDTVSLEFYRWLEEGRLTTETAAFTLSGEVPIEGLAADRDIVPPYPGITETLHLSDWDPPFPVDLKRIRPRDEKYWDDWRTTPKAFLRLDEAQRLWGHRLGRVTSLRLTLGEGADLEAEPAAIATGLRQTLLAGEEGLRAHGLVVSPVRDLALRAARGTTDFGEYFVYFSFFLVVAALLLAGLFFRLGIEQRLREVGLLRALGFTPGLLRRQFVGEGLGLAAFGGLLGMAGAAAYAAAIVWALRTVWVGAVGTRELTLTVTPGPLLLGAALGVVAAVLAIAWTLRGLVKRAPRALLSGSLEDWVPPRRTRLRVLPWLMLAMAGALLGAATVGGLAAAGAFFSAGGLLLVSALLFVRERLGARPAGASALHGLVGLGLRGATFRPGRSLLCIALVAAATFVIVSVGAFRREGGEDLRQRNSESGGFTLSATSLQPLHNDPATPEGRVVLGLPEGDALAGVAFSRFRMSAGEDASCLNLYRPSRPTVLGATAAFLREGRFAFQSSLGRTADERANPWLLLEREDLSGAVPVVVDANSLAYVFHRKLGDEMALGDSPVRVRFVAALRPGLFQSELVASERAFQSAFPGEQGYRFFLLDVPKGREDAVTQVLESRLSDFGFDASPTVARLTAFHRVENTYIATFQTLGALGLLLGTVGLATVLVRNALERRQELALLRAVGYGRRHLRTMVLSENALLLGLGLFVGVTAALLAITPALLERGGGAPLLTLLALVITVSLTGLVVSALAVSIVTRLPLLGSLRSE
jgi:putative ABC transport system permease protein